MYSIIRVHSDVLRESAVGSYIFCRNYFLIFAIFFESALACLFVYTPGLNAALSLDVVWPGKLVN